MKFFILIWVLILTDSALEPDVYIEETKTEVEFFIDEKAAVSKRGSLFGKEARLFRVEVLPAGNRFNCLPAIMKPDKCLKIEELFVAPTKLYSITRASSVTVSK